MVPRQESSQAGLGGPPGGTSPFPIEGIPVRNEVIPVRKLALIPSTSLMLALASCAQPYDKPIYSGVGVEWQGVVVQDAQIEFNVVCQGTVPIDVDRPAVFEIQAGDGETTAAALLEAAWQSQGERACTASRYGRRVRFLCRFDEELVLRIRQTTGTDTDWYEIPFSPGYSVPSGLTVTRVP